MKTELVDLNETRKNLTVEIPVAELAGTCLIYTSDAADD